MLFSLDIFEPESTASQIAVGLFVHNIPALFLLIILIISWKHEIVGGIVFILAGLLYIAIILRIILMHSPHGWQTLFWTLPISIPALLIGILFFINRSAKK
jgi:hypothetical protein